MKLSKVLLVPLVLAGASLAACESSTVTRTINSGCLIFGPIHGDPARVPAAVQDQIDAHNEVGIEECNW